MAYTMVLHSTGSPGVIRYSRETFQYPIKRLIVKSRKVSKARDRCWEFSNRSEIWHASRQHCCRGACKISKRYRHFNTESRVFEFLRDHTIRHWKGPLAGTEDINKHQREVLVRPLKGVIVRTPTNNTVGDIDELARKPRQTGDVSRDQQNQYLLEIVIRYWQNWTWITTQVD